MHALPCRLGHGTQERADAALAVGSGDMNDRRQPALRMLQFCKQRAQTVQTEIDQPRMQPMQTRDNAPDARCHAAAAATSLMRSSEMIRAKVAFSSVRFTTRSTIPCS